MTINPKLFEIRSILANCSSKTLLTYYCIGKNKPIVYNSKTLNFSEFEFFYLCRGMLKNTYLEYPTGKQVNIYQLIVSSCSLVNYCTVFCTFYVTSQTLEAQGCKMLYTFMHSYT